MKPVSGGQSKEVLTLIDGMINRYASEISLGRAVYYIGVVNSGADNFSKAIVLPMDNIDIARALSQNINKLNLNFFTIKLRRKDDHILIGFELKGGLVGRDNLRKVGEEIEKIDREMSKTLFVIQPEIFSKGGAGIGFPDLMNPKSYWGEIKYSLDQIIILLQTRQMVSYITPGYDQSSLFYEKVLPERCDEKTRAIVKELYNLILRFDYGVINFFSQIKEEKLIATALEEFVARTNTNQTNVKPMTRDKIGILLINYYYISDLVGDCVITPAFRDTVILKKLADDYYALTGNKKIYAFFKIVITETSEVEGVVVDEPKDPRFFLYGKELLAVDRIIPTEINGRYIIDFSRKVDVLSDLSDSLPPYADINSRFQYETNNPSDIYFCYDQSSKSYRYISFGQIIDQLSYFLTLEKAVYTVAEERKMNSILRAAAPDFSRSLDNFFANCLVFSPEIGDAIKTRLRLLETVALKDTRDLSEVGFGDFFGLFYKIRELDKGCNALKLGWRDFSKVIIDSYEISCGESRELKERLADVLKDVPGIYLRRDGEKLFVGINDTIAFRISGEALSEERILEISKEYEAEFIRRRKLPASTRESIDNIIAGERKFSQQIESLFDPPSPSYAEAGAPTFTPVREKSRSEIETDLRELVVKLKDQLRDNKKIASSSNIFFSETPNIEIARSLLNKERKKPVKFVTIGVGNPFVAFYQSLTEKPEISSMVISQKGEGELARLEISLNFNGAVADFNRDIESFFFLINTEFDSYINKVEREKLASERAESVRKAKEEKARIEAEKKEIADKKASIEAKKKEDEAAAAAREDLKRAAKSARKKEKEEAKKAKALVDAAKTTERSKEAAEKRQMAVEDDLSKVLEKEAAIKAAEIRRKAKKAARKAVKAGVAVSAHQAELPIPQQVSVAEALIPETGATEEVVDLTSSSSGGAGSSTSPHFRATAKYDLATFEYELKEAINLFPKEHINVNQRLAHLFTSVPALYDMIAEIKKFGGKLLLQGSMVYGHYPQDLDLVLVLDDDKFAKFPFEEFKKFSAPLGTMPESSSFMPRGQIISHGFKLGSKLEVLVTNQNTYAQSSNWTSEIDAKVFNLSEETNVNGYKLFGNFEYKPTFNRTINHEAKDLYLRLCMTSLKADEKDDRFIYAAVENLNNQIISNGSNDLIVSNIKLFSDKHFGEEKNFLKTEFFKRIMELLNIINLTASRQIAERALNIQRNLGVECGLFPPSEISDPTASKLQSGTQLAAKYGEMAGAGAGPR